MIAECFQKVVDVLKEAGYERISTDPSDLQTIVGAPAAFVWQEEPSQLEKVNRKVKFEDNKVTNHRTTRYKKYDQIVAIMVLLVDLNRTKASGKMVEFLQKLPTSFKDNDQNAIDISATGAQLIEDKSLLNSRAAMQITIKFDGGIYLDVTTPLIGSVELDQEINKL
jgi:hypothetical protein